MSHIIRVDSIHCGYHKQEVLKDISFDIEKGEFLGIIGPNGSGKSTLLRSLSRCLKPYKGSIFYKGNNLYNIGHHEIARDFAFVAQDSLFKFSFTALEIVLMGRIPYLKRTQQETAYDIETTREAMKVTDTLLFSDRQINELSAGERQMVVIAKALAQEPGVLYLDEPTSHLDIGHQVQILSLLKELNRQKGITVVIVLHDLNLASEYCDRILLLDKGCVSEVGSPDSVLTYQNIEKVYKTIVLVNRNPVSGRPHILLVTEKKLDTAQNL